MPIVLDLPAQQLDERSIMYSAGITVPSESVEIRIAADVTDAVLNSPTGHFEVGLERASATVDDWQLECAVGYNCALANIGSRYEPQLAPPSITLPAVRVAQLRASANRLRSFVRVLPGSNSIQLGCIATSTLIAVSETLPPSSHNSVAFDASAGTTGTSATSASFSHTCTGSNLCLYVGLGLNSISDNNPSATYATISMTRLTWAFANIALAHFRLVAPATGANTVSVSWTTAVAFAVNSMSFTGVDQTTPDDTPVSGGATTGTSRSDNVTSATDNMVVDVMVVDNNSAAQVTEGAGQTAVEGADSGNTIYCGVSRETGAATVTMSWSWTGGTNRNHHSACDINAAGAVSAAQRVPYLPLLGVQ